MTISSDYDLASKFTRESGSVFLTGVQALARLPIEQVKLDRAAGLNTAGFLSGYPGSPLGGFDQEVSRALRHFPDLPIVHEPAVNEELGATAVMGSQLAAARPDAKYDGVVGYWYGKAPGFDRAGDALRHGVFAGTSPRSGAVALVGDDPACKSSTMPSSSDAALFNHHMPTLYPGNIAECIELGLHAVALSRTTGLWSGLKIVTPVADGSGVIDLPALQAHPIMPETEIDGKTWKRTPSAKFLGAARMLAAEKEFREIRMPLALRYAYENGLNWVSVDTRDAWIGLVATGFTYYEMLDALRRLGFENEQQIRDAGIRLLQMRMPIPFNSALIRRFAEGLDEIVVVEEKNATLERLIKESLYKGPHQPTVVGKYHEDGSTLMRGWGQLDADAMLDGLRSRLEPRLKERMRPAREESPLKLIPIESPRTPFFCSGCPHNWGTKVPGDALVGAGTGCHGMILLMDEERVGENIGVTAMGNEGAQWIGLEPFVEAEHIFQNYGDGTYFHSAQLALQNCIGAGKNITFKILYNGTVAMTGGQDSPSPVGVPELAQILTAQGVSKLAITTEDVSRYDDAKLPKGVTVYDRDEIVQVQERLREIPGVTVLIHDQYCAAELRRDRRRGRVETPKTRVVINHRICEGCGDCGDVSNCLSVQPVDTPLGRKTTIDQDSCNLDMSCLKGDCPSFMTVELSDEQIKRSGVSADDPIAPPTDLGLGDLVRLRLAGIGGTGVVTVAQILSTAAMFDGWHVKGLDQTGLSQKAGPVVSDIILNRGAIPTSNLVGHGQANLILGFDSLVAGSDQVVAGAATDRTAAVSSTHRTPTGKMVSEPTLDDETDKAIERLKAVTMPDSTLLPNSKWLATNLTGNPAAANVLMLGVAVQAGHIPISTDAIREAIKLNGVAIDANLAAFDWGRRWAADPDEVNAVAEQAKAKKQQLEVTVGELPDRLARKIAAVDLPAELASLIETLAADLVDYQDVKYARRFIGDVEEAAKADRGVDGQTGALTEAVARSLHKLLAYKDEYEVARLMLVPEAEAAAVSVGGADPDYSWQLHPPMLKALGREGKLKFGKRSRPMFDKLAKGKRLRGTKLDPFGRTEMRRTERALPEEFCSTMNTVYKHLNASNYDAAVEIAELPDIIRGFEDLKMRRVAEYRTQNAELLAAYLR